MAHEAASPLDLIGRWYVVHTLPHREFGAAAQLEQQGFTTFLPAHMKTVRHARQFRTVKAAFFPSYLFVQLAIGRDRWRSVNGTFGVARLLMEGDRPKPIRFDIVEALLAAADQRGILATEPSLKRGDSVRIVSGPFAGLVGELASLDDHGRVSVLLDLFGSRRPVTATRFGLVAAG